MRNVERADWCIAGRGSTCGDVDGRGHAAAAITAIELVRVHVAPGAGVVEWARARVEALLVDITAD